MIVGRIKSKHIIKDIRFSGGFYLNENAINSRILEENRLKCLQLDQLADVWNPPIFKRQFCQKTERAIPYCQSSDVTNTLEGSDVFINKIQATKVGSVVEENQILITGFGTIGNTRLVNELSSGISYANNVCRVKANEDVLHGYLYAVLTSKYGRSQLNKNASGSVVRYIEAAGIKKTLIPILTEPKQQEIHKLIVGASNLRMRANAIINSCRMNLKSKLSLPALQSYEYEHFGTHGPNKQVSFFARKRSELSSLTINAFNYSKKVEILEERVKTRSFLRLSDCLNETHFFSSGSFKRLELDSPKSVKLINQSDIFDFRKVGKKLAKLHIKSAKLVEYGEVLIAGVGTLGEGETFCRTIFANEELEGQLVSGEFIRMKTNDKVPSGYLYAWLSSDYGFRFIRKTQTGTKLCRPIQELLKNIPVPIIDKEVMFQIDAEVKKAHTMLFDALKAENEAIGLVEKEIESWQKS